MINVQQKNKVNRCHNVVVWQEYLFSPSESAGDIAQYVFDSWPPEWEEEAVSVTLSNQCCGSGMIYSGSSY